MGLTPLSSFCDSQAPVSKPDSVHWNRLQLYHLRRDSEWCWSPRLDSLQTTRIRFHQMGSDIQCSCSTLNLVAQACRYGADPKALTTKSIDFDHILWNSSITDRVQLLLHYHILCTVLAYSETGIDLSMLLIPSYFSRHNRISNAMTVGYIT